MLTRVHRGQRPRNRVRRGVACSTWVAGAAISILAAGCGNDIDGAITTTRPSTSAPPNQPAPSTSERLEPDTPETVSTTGQATTSVPVTTTSTTARPATSMTKPAADPPASSQAPTDSLDWDGVRWDFGAVLSVDTTARTIEFDRYTLYGDEAADLTSEPIVYGNTDMPYLNQNPATRRFALAEDAELLELLNEREAGNCDFEDRPDIDPIWGSISVVELANIDPGPTQTSLTFDAAGLVTRVRVSYGC